MFISTNPYLKRLGGVLFSELKGYNCKKCFNHNKRFASTVEKHKLVPSLTPFSQDDNKEFMCFFSLIVKDIMQSSSIMDIEKYHEYFTSCLENNVPNGKRVRGLTTVITYKFLEDPNKLTPENIKLANILGWSTELLEGAVTIFDDIMDNSFTRRKSVSWFKRPEIGMKAISDGVALNNWVFVILKKYFSSHPYYTQMLELFHDISFKTAVGQSIDSLKYKPHEITMENFKTIAKYKTGFYTFYLPVILGMYFSKKFSSDLYDETTPILLDMGEFFQVQNDYNDVFGKSKETGKGSNDIEESKCTWLAATALQMATPLQRKLMEDHYGKTNKEAIEKIQNLYNELDLSSEFKAYEENNFKYMCNRIERLTGGQRELLHILVEKLYKKKFIFSN